MDLTVLSPKKYWNLNAQNLRIWPYLKIEEALHNQVKNAVLIQYDWCPNKKQEIWTQTRTAGGWYKDSKGEDSHATGVIQLQVKESLRLRN